PHTKKFTEPPEQIKNEIAGLKGDKSVPEADKKEGLAQLETALKMAKPIQFKENVASAKVLRPTRASGGLFDHLVGAAQEREGSTGFAHHRDGARPAGHTSSAGRIASHVVSVMSRNALDPFG